MTLQEAYITAKMCDEEFEDAYLIECLDYSASWGFAFSPIPYDPKDPHTWVGGGYVTVDKETGKLGAVNAITSWQLNGKKVSLKLLEGLIRPVTEAKKKQNAVPRAAVASQAVPA
jgi:hypothetical protein